ncbi:MAG TPA: hypothetical protein PKA64_01590 [Myxococcota bacterium]|nr:hypothetical protein [Myxococcota bacterium]
MPPFMRGPEGRGYARGLGAAVDERAAVLRTAALARNPRRCPDDALDAVGQAYNLPHFDGEPNGDLTSGYRGRLCAAWDTWDKAGSADAIIASLKAYGFTDVEVYATCPQYREDGTVVPAWTSADGNYADFWVKIGPDFGALGPIGPLVMPFTMPSTLGSTAPQSVIKAIKGQVLRWKAAHAFPRRVIFHFSGVLLGPPLVMPFTMGGSAASFPIF